MRSRRPAMRALAHHVRARAVTVTMLSVATLVAVLDLSAWLEYDRSAFGAGAFWTGLGAHFAHYSPGHFAWNALGLCALGALFEPAHRRRFVATVLGSMMAIPVALYVFADGIETYRGLSGVVTALFGLGAVGLVREQWRTRKIGLAITTVILASLFVARLAVSWTSGATAFVADAHASFVPVPLAHGVGLAVGLAIACAKLPRRKMMSNSKLRIAIGASTALLCLAIPTERASAHAPEDEAVRIYVDSRTTLHVASTSPPARALDAVDRRTRAPYVQRPSGDRFWGEPCECPPRDPHARAPRSMARRPGPYVSGAPAIHVRSHRPSARSAPPRGLLPNIDAAAQQSYRAMQRDFDPIVDPILEGATQAVGTAGGAALGIALYPPAKVIEHVLGVE